MSVLLKRMRFGEEGAVNEEQTNQLDGDDGGDN